MQSVSTGRGTVVEGMYVPSGYEFANDPTRDAAPKPPSQDCSTPGSMESRISQVWDISAVDRSMAETEQ